MSKTPEEMAEEYMNQDKVACAAINHAAEHLVKAAFIAGCEAAKKQERLKLSELYSHGSDVQKIASAYLKNKGIEGALLPYAENRFIEGYQAAAPQWISVRERLPECGESYLVLKDDGTSPYQLAIVWFDRTWDFSNADEITHWMALPAAPEEK